MESGLTLAKVISLAVVDAINPCALAVLTMMLIAIITYNPKNKMKIVWSGLAFAAAVFIMYMIYGLLIIRSFQLVQGITEIRVWLYKILGSAAVLLGALQIKDFLFYKPGGVATEMPMGLRPKLNKIINNITSPWGAFGIGLFVTLFLLPCTIGPYVILGGMLSFMEILKTIPMLILYNLIFIAPIIIITGMVYLGLSRVEDVSVWKDKNIRKLHFVSGLIILCFGIAMLIGLV